MQTLQPCLAPLLLLIAFLNAGCSASVGSRGGSETTRIYDPVGVLENSLDASDFNRTRAMLSRFEAELGRDYLCQWAVTAGLAFVDQGSPEPLSQLAEQYAQAMGLTTGKNGVLLLLSAGSFPGIAFAGSLISTEPGASAELLGRGEWVAARDQAVELLRAARPGAAARIALQGLAAALGPGLEPGNSRAIFEQKKLLSWKSDFQSGELWENLCGDRRCLELVLDDVRQLSAGFEAYYHEAMTFPALNLLGPAKKRRLAQAFSGQVPCSTKQLSAGKSNRLCCKSWPQIWDPQRCFWRWVGWRARIPWRLLTIRVFSMTTLSITGWQLSLAFQLFRG
eukprot:TRINITY_DN4958_c0_g1_i2.p1 TRINITY_DN4958_c0_g1~~TRINITY_DN4958_c0_g1_i2.p1  ORF type:complete len:337 (-),score=54.23 TRINITY_DN4958_c0_g1_i2:697-1707(-)